MPLFSRSTSQLQIPPVASTGQSTTLPNHSTGNKYSRSRGVGDVYTRGGIGPNQLDQDRNELFSGYNPSKSGSGQFVEDDNGDEEEDVEVIKRKIKGKKLETVNSSQNSIRLAREAVETGNNTLRRLGEQGERLGNTELHLDRAQGHNRRADDKTEELRKLNRSIFIPAVTFDNDDKHAAREAKVQRRYEENRVAREKARVDPRMGRPGGREEIVLSGGRHMKSTERGRFQFEATASDDEMEDALESNLDEIQGLVRDLKGVSMAMGAEIDRQDAMISVLEKKTVGLEGSLIISTAKLHRAGGM
ncbi:hypothetical protein B0H12DRAFT_1075649 [Mycena haematopus]|nr:hypothetical protein B0H12DRAFT_1075649 [Mycena haematopus]